jgi:3-polyprenyl-4-hydroxybenzoate decarboxylase
MTELIVAILGAGGAILALRLFDKHNINKQQERLEKKVVENDKKIARLEGEQAQEDKQTKEKVDEIDREKNDKPSSSDLSAWFNRRR